MKEFACGDVVAGCDVRFSHHSDDEILAAVASHAHRDHGLTEVGPDLVSAVRAAIRVAG